MVGYTKCSGRVSISYPVCGTHHANPLVESIDLVQVKVTTKKDVIHETRPAETERMKGKTYWKYNVTRWILLEVSNGCIGWEYCKCNYSRAANCSKRK